MDWYEIRAVVKNCLFVKNVRASRYTIVEQNHGYYPTMNRQDVIHYPLNDKDLHLRIHFHSLGDAESYQTALLNTNTSPIGIEVLVEEDIGTVTRCSFSVNGTG